MKKNNEVKKEQAAKNQPPTPAAAPKAVKASREPAPKVEKEEEPVDRLPSSVQELKESKSGLVTFLFLTGKDKEDITKELQTAFSLTEGQAVKIIRRITGRARFFRRAFDLMAAK
ncbi:MAG: hypothetical protein M5U12_12080 [Verrucomicrobia bacterium]|nr:hypothetical protein [Verrucomicrobiota bacterium]